MENNTYVSIAETVEDCQAIVRWLEKRRAPKIKVIALSLESFHYLSKSKKVDCLYVWDILDMENIFHQCFFDSQQATEEWLSLFSGRKDNFYEIAAQYEMDVNIFYHSLVSIRVVEHLRTLFSQNNWTYLSPPAKLILQSKYFPFSQKQSQKNLIFQCVLAELFAASGIKMKYISPFSKIKIRFLAFIFITHIVKKLFYDIYQTFKGLVFRLENIDNILKTCPKHVDIITSGWGSNLHRMLSINQLKESIDKRDNITCLNLVWRPHKIQEFDIEKSSSPKFQNVLVREEITKGTAYGPKLSMFPIVFWLKYVTKLFLGIILPRFKKIFNGNEIENTKLLEELFRYRAIRIDTAFTVFFSYRAIFLTTELDKKLFIHLSPLIFIGSDSGAADTRGELLIAKQFGISTFSAPHGYQAYSMPSYNYLADKVLTHGKRSQELLIQTGVSPERIIPIGNNHPRQGQEREMSDRIKIVIITRSRGGLWSNYSSCHNVYDKEIRGLISLLANEDEFSVVIKSHPNGDYHKYYDLLVKDFNSDRIQHISKGWKLDEFVESCDIAVCIGESPSFFLSALFLNIPLIFIDGTMTKTLKGLHYDYQEACKVVSSFADAFQEIKRIVSDEKYRKNLLFKQNRFIQGYTKKHPEENLTVMLERAPNKSQS